MLDELNSKLSSLKTENETLGSLGKWSWKRAPSKNYDILKVEDILL